MSDAVLVAIIGAVSALLIAYMEYSRRSTKNAVGEVHHEVTANGGGSAHDQIIKRIEGMESDIRGMRRDNGRVADGIAAMPQVIADRITAAILNHEYRQHR